MSLEHRLQILIDDDRHERLLAAARERGVSVATIVREAIDRGLPAGNGRRRAAVERVLAAPAVPPTDTVGQLVEAGEALRLR